MKLPLQLKAISLAVISACAALSLAVGAGKLFQSAPASAIAPTGGESGLVSPPPGTLAGEGYQLFLLNCAHCHGSDARGDEGPNLHGVTKSDERIAALIKSGIKGEMPKFGSKLNEANIKALIAFVRFLK